MNQVGLGVMDSPTDFKRYRELLNQTPIRRTDREKRQSKGVFITPRYSLKRQKKFDTSYFVDLPDEVWTNILRYLGLFDLVKVGKTCKRLNSIYRDDYLWKRHYLRLFFGQKHHFFPLDERRCTVDMTGPFNKPDVVCIYKLHYIVPSDGKAPTCKENFYLKTAERLYKLQVKSATVNQKKNLDRKYLWVFKLLYPEKYVK